jgi:hypothetical protein
MPATSLKTRRSLLASAARTATATSAVQHDATQQCIRAYLNVTVASGSGGLKLFFQGVDLVSGTAANLNGGGAAQTAAGIYVYELMPNNSTAAGNVIETAGRALPCVWQVQVTVGDASSYTYSVGIEVFPG